MRISKINANASFNGLWEIRNTKCGRADDKVSGNVVLREAIYHPFTDETTEEISQEIKDIKSKPVLVCDIDLINNLKDHKLYVVTKPLLGRRLEFTKKQYLYIKNMEESGLPTNDEGQNYCISDDRFGRIGEVMKQNGISDESEE